MPIYDIQHCIPLSPTQKDALATKITHIHTTTFTTPKLFVQIEFTDVADRWTYLGGRRRAANHIRGQVRSGPSRTQKDWNELCRALAEAWEEVVGAGGDAAAVNGVDDGATGGKKKGGDTSLRSVVLVGGMVGGLEAGFILPPAGGDVEWLRENWEAFNEKARNGDEEMAEMVKEVEERGLMDGTNGLKTAAQRLEEMLGWGDSA